MSCFLLQGVVEVDDDIDGTVRGEFVLDGYANQKCFFVLEKIFTRHKETTLGAGDRAYVFAKASGIFMDESGVVKLYATLQKMLPLPKESQQEVSLMYIGTGFVSYIQELKTTQSGRVYMDYGFSSTFYQKQKKASEKIYLRPRLWGLSAEKFSKKEHDRIEVVADVKTFGKFISRNGHQLYSIALHTPIIDRKIPEFSDRSAEDTPTKETINTPIQAPPSTTNYEHEQEGIPF